MSYIYHLRPEPFEGTSLIPLNSMDQNSELYKKYAKKYVGREDLMDGIIPILDCKWNDVVQFSALDPQIIVNELRKHQDDLTLSRLQYFKVVNEEKYIQHNPQTKDGDYVFEVFCYEGDQVVEHWDTTEKVPPKSKWKNDNGKF